MSIGPSFCAVYAVYKGYEPAMDVLVNRSWLRTKQEGTLILKRSESNAVTAMFAPNFGGGALEPKLLENQESLDEFLAALDVSEEIKRRAIAELGSRGTATIPRISLSQAQLEEHWPTQLACQA